MVQGRSTGIDLAHSHHVARYCRRRHLRPDGRPLRDAFLLRPGEEYLSTNWLEHFHHSDRQVQIAGVRAALTGKGFQVSRGAAFAVLNVGPAIAACQTESNVEIQFTVLGENHDPSHTGIFGYTAEDTDTAAVLANLALEVYPAP